MPEREELLALVLDAYSTTPAAFGTEWQADASLFTIYADFFGERGWDYPVIFKGIRQKLTAVLARDPYGAAVAAMNETPENVDPAVFRGCLREGDPAAVRLYNRFASASSVGCDCFHRWLFKAKPELGRKVRALLPPSLPDDDQSGIEPYRYLRKGGTSHLGIITILGIGIVALVGWLTRGKSPRDRAPAPESQPAISEASGSNAADAVVSAQGGLSPCDGLPTQFDRKACLIDMGDRTRSDPSKAAGWYLRALSPAMEYDPTGLGARLVSGMMVHEPDLSAVQTIIAQRRLSSVMAALKKYRQASDLWHAHLEGRVGRAGMYFDGGFVTEKDCYLAMTLWRRAGYAGRSPAVLRPDPTAASGISESGWCSFGADRTSFEGLLAYEDGLLAESEGRFARAANRMWVALIHVPGSVPNTDGEWMLWYGQHESIWRDAFDKMQRNATWAEAEQQAIRVGDLLVTPTPILLRPGDTVRLGVCPLFYPWSRDCLGDAPWNVRLVGGVYSDSTLDEDREPRPVDMDGSPGPGCRYLEGRAPGRGERALILKASVQVLNRAYRAQCPVVRQRNALCLGPEGHLRLSETDECR